MANIVLGIGCAHDLRLDASAEHLEANSRAEMGDAASLWFHGERTSYEQLLAHRDGADEPIQTDDRAAMLTRANDALTQLRDAFATAEPDIAVIFGTDHDEMFHGDIRPAFSILGCESFAVSSGNGVNSWPGHPVLATYLAEAVQRSEFDISYARQQRRTDGQPKMPHAYTFVYSQLFGDRLTANVPIDINGYFPPNQPQAARCYALGRRIGKAIRSWDNDARIAIIASGGLSHPVIDEEFDRDILEAMESGDFKYLQSYHEGHYQAGASQAKTWAAMGGAIQGSYLKGRTIDYCPLYRTPAGTGESAAFMLWL